MKQRAQRCTFVVCCSSCRSECGCAAGWLGGAAVAVAAAADGGSRRHLPRRGVGREWGQGGGSLGRHLTTCRRPKPSTTTTLEVAVAAVLITTTNNSIAV